MNSRGDAGHCSADALARQIRFDQPERRRRRSALRTTLIAFGGVILGSSLYGYCQTGSPGTSTRYSLDDAVRLMHDAPDRVARRAAALQAIEIMEAIDFQIAEIANAMPEDAKHWRGFLRLRLRRAASRVDNLEGEGAALKILADPR